MGEREREGDNLSARTSGCRMEEEPAQRSPVHDKRCVAVTQISQNEKSESLITDDIVPYFVL